MSLKYPLLQSSLIQNFGTDPKVTRGSLDQIQTAVDLNRLNAGEYRAAIHLDLARFWSWSLIPETKWIQEDHYPPLFLISSRDAPLRPLGPITGTVPLCSSQNIHIFLYSQTSGWNMFLGQMTHRSNTRSRRLINCLIDQRSVGFLPGPTFCSSVCSLSRSVIRSKLQRAGFNIPAGAFYMLWLHVVFVADSNVEDYCNSCKSQQRKAANTLTCNILQQLPSV